VLPSEAPWLADFETEILAFPNGRYDDQVDAVLLFLDWFSDNEQYITPVLCWPIVITGSEPDRWACRF